MRLARLDSMKRGWFVGDFDPTLYRTTDVEIGVKDFAAGESEALHVHKIATEVTAILEGHARLNEQDLGPGDIAVLEPGEAAEFTALTDVRLVVVKLPGAKNDKYVVET